MAGTGWRRVLFAIGLILTAAAPRGVAGAVVAASGGAAGAGLWHGGARVALKDVKDWSSVPIPSFSRQTKLPCTACHTTFPQLTAFGRLFKLNGYTLSGIEQIRATLPDTLLPPTLALDVIPPVSVMAQASLTHVAEEEPGTQNDNAEFPQQLSLFVGEAITPQIGTFLQVTYSGNDGSLGMDNADIRYANHTQLADRPLIYGVTLNNNPTVQDVWNTVPAWSFPFASSDVAPTPVAAPLLAGALAQQVAGLGAYVFWNNLLYAELSGYRSAPQGGAHPPDTSAVNTLSGVAPYWRVALNKQFGPQSIEVGTYGMRIHLFPKGIAGATDRFADLGFDAQYEREAGKMLVSGHATWLREQQAFDASLPAGTVSNSPAELRTWKADISGFVPTRRIGATLGYFAVSGSTDATLYAPASVAGSATGSPNSSGFIGQLDFNPWLNTRFSAQYVLYNKFNGGTTNYDGSNRSASNNNTLYLLAWLVF